MRCPVVVGAVITVVLAGVVLTAEPDLDPVSQLPPRRVPWRGLDEHASWALAWMACQPPERWCDIRFVSWNAVPQEMMSDFRQVNAIWVNQLHFRKTATTFKEVPGTAGRLQWFYLSDYGWTAPAWEAVAERDPYVREEQGVGSGSPSFLKNIKGAHPQALAYAKEAPTVAETLRLMIGYRVPEKQYKDGKFPLVSMTWGPFQMKEQTESNRSSSYYDLLFAKQRFVEVKGQGKKVTKTIDWPGGDFTWPADSEYAGKITKNLKPGRFEYDIYETGDKNVKFVNFPKNVEEAEKAFGIDVVRKFGKEQYIDLTTGAVVEGGQDQPERGSIVTLHNRLLEFIKGPLGVNARSFDVIDPTGFKDYIEQAPKLAVGKIAFDAGEHLYALPGGGIAWMLSDGQQNRVEVAAQLAASGQNLSKKLNIGVTNPGACFICHAGSGGYIPPRNVLVEMKKNGTNLNIKDKDLLDRVNDFYFSWEKEVEDYQKPFNALCHKIAGWDGVKFGSKLQECLEWYDKPVPTEQAAAEFGMEPEVFRAVAAKSVSGQVAKMLDGLPITRRTYEQDTYRTLGLLFAAQQK